MPAEVPAIACIVLVSCMAGFDRHIVDFTEGPLVFRLDSDALEVPAGLLLTRDGACTVADVGCTDPACPAAATSCGDTGSCLVRPVATLYQAVDVDHAYGGELLRVDSVRLEQLDASVAASTLTVPVDRILVLWAPATAPRGDAALLATLGAVEPGRAAGPLDPAIDEAGLEGLEEHLRSYSRFQIFVEFETTLVPGGPCPDGELEIGLSMNFVLVAEPTS
jgi:hypothetical protein